MALRGSLHEFELADIFQLIANDGKTGQLVIYDKTDEAFVIFSRGKIIAAGNNMQNLQTILFRYLIQIRRYSEKELNELLYLCHGEMKMFTHELISKNYIDEAELKSIVNMSIEDLACNLFLWENGHYRFDSLESVDDYMTSDIALPSDAVTMEAMRRVDEWQRMKKSIDPNTVFAPVKQRIYDYRIERGIDFNSYILSLIDGVTTVNEICETSFFTEYRIYETLQEFCSSNKIIPYKIPSIANKGNITTPNSIRHRIVSQEILFIIAIHCIALFIVLAGINFHSETFNEKIMTRNKAEKEITMYNLENQIRIKGLYYQCIYGNKTDADNK
jgi:hypothetical protein